MRIVTGRLELVPATAELTRYDLEAPEAFAAHLEAHVPESWPPELLADAREPLARMLAEDPGLAGWLLWYWLLCEPAALTAPFPAAATRLLVGVGGFKGRPSKEGMIEVGYALLPEYQGVGLGSEGLHGLLAWGFAHSTVSRIDAETLPGLGASIRLLEKAGFVRATTPAIEEGALRFELAEDRFQRSGP